MRHLMSPLDLSKEELDDLLTLASDIEKNPKKYAHVCDDKRLATCFYEPSTRTRLSFEAAMMNLGGKVLGFSSAGSSSAAKGESVADTIRVVSCYADICAMRHPKEGAPLVASMASSIPVINAGDGGHQHPTQTLTDLLTIRSLKGRLDNLTIGLCGQLFVVHGLVLFLQVQHFLLGFAQALDFLFGVVAKQGSNEFVCHLFFHLIVYFPKMILKRCLIFAGVNNHCTTIWQDCH